MKKLMIAAAAAAMVSGVFAEDACGLGEVSGCAEVYDVTMSVKTTACKLLYTAAKKDKCGLSTQEICDCYRDVVTVKIAGVLWSCTCTCASEDVPGSTLSLNTPDARWDLNYGDAWVPDSQIFWIAKQKTILEDLMLFTHLYRIGKTNQKVEAAGTFGPLTFAGFGAFDAKAGHVKNISGGVAGLWTATPDCTLSFNTPSDDDDFGWCPAYNICPLINPTIAEDLNVTAAYGTFKVKYNASKSKALAKGRSAMYGKIVPKAVFSYGTTPAYKTAE